MSTSEWVSDPALSSSTVGEGSRKNQRFASGQVGPSPGEVEVAYREPGSLGSPSIRRLIGASAVPSAMR